MNKTTSETEQQQTQTPFYSSLIHKDEEETTFYSGYSTKNHDQTTIKESMELCFESIKLYYPFISNKGKPTALIQRKYKNGLEIKRVLFVRLENE